MRENVMKFNNDRDQKKGQKWKFIVRIEKNHKARTLSLQKKVNFLKKILRKNDPACVLCILVTINGRKMFQFWLLSCSGTSHSPSQPLEYQNSSFYPFFSSFTIYLLSFVAFSPYQPCSINIIFFYVNNSWPQTSTTKFCLSPHTSTTAASRTHTFIHSSILHSSAEYDWDIFRFCFFFPFNSILPSNLSNIRDFFYLLSDFLPISIGWPTLLLVQKYFLIFYYFQKGIQNVLD